MNKGIWILSLLAAAQLAAAAPEPLITRAGDPGQAYEFRLGIESFQNVELDEVDGFDGWTATAEAAMPLGRDFRLRMVYPFRTDGDAVIKDDQPAFPGQDVHIEGNGGVYDFFTIGLEWQLRRQAEDGYALSWYLNGGVKADRLDTDKYNPWEKNYDVFNHTGEVISTGVRYDRPWGPGHLFANLGLRVYVNADDIYPGGNKNTIPALDLDAAMVFSPWGQLHPALELIYFGDLSDLNQFSLVPELLLPLGRHLELKAGVPVGLGGTGSEIGGRAQVVVRF